MRLPSGEYAGHTSSSVESPAMTTGLRPPTRWTTMSHVPFAFVAYANDSPSGEMLGLVSMPAASVSCVNADHLGSGPADRRPSHQASGPVRMIAPTTAASILTREPVRPGAATRARAPCDDAAVS